MSIVNINPKFGKGNGCHDPVDYWTLKRLYLPVIMLQYIVADKALAGQATGVLVLHIILVHTNCCLAGVFELLHRYRYSVTITACRTSPFYVRIHDR